MAKVIREASMRNLLDLAPGVPATDSGRSMDFDRIRYDDAIRAVAPDAPSYDVAARAVLGRLPSLLP